MEIKLLTTYEKAWMDAANGVCDEAEYDLLVMIRDRGPIKARALAWRWAGSTGAESNVRAMIGHLRRDHFIPICSGQDGFWFPENAGEVDHTIAHFSSRIREMKKVRDSIVMGAANFFGPPTLFPPMEG